MNLINQFPFEVDDQSKGIRFDRFLSDFSIGVSRNQIVDLIQEGCFLVNSRRVKPSYKLKKGDVLSFSGRLSLSEEFDESLPYSGPPIEILFEDAKLLIVNKPEGLVVHPGSGISIRETLYWWLRSSQKLAPDDQWPEELRVQRRQGVVHRLDKGTSGVLVLAKDPETQERLSNMFRLREMDRYYWALLEGNLETRLLKRMTKVEAYLTKGWAALKKNAVGIWSLATHHSRDPNNPLRYRVDREGKRAISHFFCRHTREKDCFLELKLSTGRTHQIRVHMAFLGCPVMGDVTYGGQAAARVFLHAYRMSFVHPWTGEKILVDASSRSFESFSKILGYRPQDYRLDSKEFPGAS